MASVRRRYRQQRGFELLRGPACATGSANSRTVGNPLAGVWEVTVDARRTSDTDAAPYTLTASILGASVSPNPDVIAAAPIGVPVARSYTITNGFGAFTGRAIGSTLGRAVQATPTIAGGAQQQFMVQVAAGSTSLRAAINNPSDPAADLDLFVGLAEGAAAPRDRVYAARSSNTTALSP